MRSGRKRQHGGGRGETEPSGAAPLVCNTSHRWTGVACFSDVVLMRVIYEEGHLGSEG